MTDGPIRAAIKRLSRALFEVELAIRRRWRRARGKERWLLSGTCEGCAKCCEAPTIQVGRLVATLPMVRSIFLWWQRTLNGFEHVRTERRPYAFVFRCTHFDAQTRRCDSYDTRPGICRDYPRGLLEQPWPDLFPECGYRPVASDAPRLVDILDNENLTDEQREKLRKKLFLE